MHIFKTIESRRRGVLRKQSEAARTNIFLKQFWCYVEGTEFEVIIDNQALKYLFTKKDLSRREAKWIDLLGQLGIKNVALQPGRVHVLGDAVARLAHASHQAGLSNI